MELTSYFKKILLVFLMAFFSFSIVNAKTVIRTDEAAIGEADPAKFSDNIDSIIMFNTYDALVDELKNGAGLAPHLASSWEYADSTTLNVTLRDGVKFHSGNTLHRVVGRKNSSRLSLILSFKFAENILKAFVQSLKGILAK